MKPETISDPKTRAVYARLVETYGERDLTPRRDPLHELISTILSQRTTWANEELAYKRMWERFGSWEGIRDAPEGELAKAIAPSNYPETKAPQIKRTLAQIIEERGEARIDFLKGLNVADGLAWLTALPGVGIKTAALVLLFCFSKPILPVDTHVYRVSQRAGLISQKVKSSTAAHVPLARLLPEDAHVLYNFHIALLLHGQRVCVWKAPKCERCPLTDSCAWYAENRS